MRHFQLKTHHSPAEWKSGFTILLTGLFYTFQYSTGIFLTVMLLTHDNRGTTTAPESSPTELLPSQLLLARITQYSQTQ